jgi:hypothetical protein
VEDHLAHIALLPSSLTLTPRSTSNIQLPMINIQVENERAQWNFLLRLRRLLHGVLREGAEPATPLWLNLVSGEVHRWPKPSGGLSRQPGAGHLRYRWRTELGSDRSERL